MTAAEARRRPDSMLERWGWLTPAVAASAEMLRPDRSRMTRKAWRLRRTARANQFYGYMVKDRNRFPRLPCTCYTCKGPAGTDH